MRRRLHPTEHDNQVAVFDYAARALGQYPDLALLHAIPLGGSRSYRFKKNGKRYSPEGQRLAREGVAAGVPDVHLPVGRGSSHSLYIEMKLPGKEPTELQWAWIEALRKAGNAVFVCHSAEEAIERLQSYLNTSKG